MAGGAASEFNHQQDKTKVIQGIRGLIVNLINQVRPSLPAQIPQGRDHLRWKKHIRIVIVHKLHSNPD
jgi:hypothetical protein